MCSILTSKPIENTALPKYQAYSTFLDICIALGRRANRALHGKLDFLFQHTCRIHKLNLLHVLKRSPRRGGRERGVWPGKSRDAG